MAKVTFQKYNDEGNNLRKVAREAIQRREAYKRVGHMIAMAVGYDKEGNLVLVAKNQLGKIH